MVNFTNHFLGFVSCSDSAKIVGFFGFLIASLPQTKIVLEVFVKALGKNQKKIPFLCKTTERRGLVLYIPYFLFTSITIFSTEILSMYLQHLQKSIYKSPLLFLIAFGVYRVFFHSLKKKGKKCKLIFQKSNFPPIYEKVYQRSYSQFFYIAQKNIFPQQYSGQSFAAMLF